MIEYKENQKLDDLEKILKENGCYYGRAKRFTHPSMKKFLIKNQKANIEYFNISKISEGLNNASSYIANLIKENKKILFVGAKPAAENSIKKIADEFDMPYINFKWIGGFITNFQTIKNRNIYFKELLKKEESGEIEEYPPKDQKRIKRELEKMKKIYGGVINMEELPDAIFIVDLNFKSHKTALKEAIKKNIPIIAICGSDNNTTKVNVIVPGNDKAPKSIEFMIEYIIKRVKEKLGNG